MTVSSTSSRVVYQGNGVTTVFPFIFKIARASELGVVFTDVDGVETTLSPSVYGATGFGLDAGGTVTYPLTGSPIVNGTSLTLYRDVPLTQPTTVNNQGAMWPAQLEQALDRLTMIDQKNADEAGRALKIPRSDALTLKPLPNALIRANTVLAFDENGQPIVAAFPDVDFIEKPYTIGNIPILTPTGIKDSGKALVDTVVSGSVLSNNTGGMVAPQFNTRLNLLNGSASAVAFGFVASPGTGLYSSGANQAAIATNGNLLFNFLSTSTGTNYLEAFAGAAQATIRAAGATNGSLQLASNGTGNVEILQAGSAGGIYIARFVGSAGAVNYLRFSNAASGANVRIGASAENIVLGTGGGLATNATSGMILIPSCAGTPTGAPTGAAVGQIPMIYDTTGNKLWFYSGSTWRGVAVT